MGRNKALASLSKAERKRVKDGVPVEDKYQSKGNKREVLKKPRNNDIADIAFVAIHFKQFAAFFARAWRQNLTERWGDLDAATRTARRTVLNSSFWAEQIRAMA